ncbi:hypothetical protein AcV7_007581 [Taiwanofungus camphoratus]|nr:hypothetical protein AcV7_007581 [Antrodia cinnamomea]
MLYAGLVNSDPFTDPDRAGFVATSQIPVIIVLATKNNVLGALVGQGYQKLNMMRIEVPQLNAGWRAEQHLRIKVLSRGMGRLGWSESHPFTIASVSKDHGAEGLVLMCKKAGDWTGKLAKRAEYGEAGGVGRDVKVLIEGPYGGPGHSIPSSFSSAMVVAGGSGITYALSTMQELMKKDAQRSSCVKIVEFVWSVPNPSNLVPLLPLFSSLLAQSHLSYMSLRIAVFYTRAPTSGDVFKPFRTLPSGLTLSLSHLCLSKILEAIVDRTCALYSEGRRRPHRGSLTGVLIGVCGPLALAEDVRKAVRTFRQDRHKRVSGIELHKEYVLLLVLGSALLTTFFHGG